VPFHAAPWLLLLQHALGLRALWWTLLVLAPCRAKQVKLLGLHLKLHESILHQCLIPSNVNTCW
jgi:hypothetical protein